MNDAIVRQPVRTAVRERVIQRIVDGTLAAGDGINLATVAAGLAVSPTPLREALIELERDGFVASSQGRGFFVRPYDAHEVEEIYPLIWTLEVLALRSSPPRAPAALRRLQLINHELGAAADAARALELDLLWHATLLEACSNGLLLDILKSLKQRAQRYEFAYMKESGHKVSTEHHSGVVRALRAGDINGAAKLIEENWRIGPRFLLPWLEARQQAERAVQTRARVRR
jgi:DNA-binding GntR family transcriptional regulator